MAKRVKKKTARKRRGAKLGQHFLTAQWAAATLAECIRITPELPVLEIGPGTGNLTKELLRRNAKVIAVEKDLVLVETLRARFSSEIGNGALTIITDDIRNVTPSDLKLTAGKYLLAANIPYYITGEIIRTCITDENPPARMALLIQKEVAERIARSSKGSILSLSVRAYGDPHYIKTVSRGCFSPPPSVDSAILLIENISRSRIVEVSEKRFFEIIKKGFGSKRKMIGGNLKGLVDSESLKDCGIAPQARAENIPLEKWICLASKKITGKSAGNKVVRKEEVTKG